MEAYQDNDIIVVGAGAAGMMAALTAAEQGKRVVLLEKMDQAGRKLRITGKGRCNLTNTSELKDFLTHVGSDARFLRNSFSAFFNHELMDFFESKGVELVLERGNRVFPKSGKSLDIFLALVQSIENNPRITFVKQAEVARLLVSNQQVRGVILKNEKIIHAPKVILATGGLSYPSTGSTGDGYAMAQTGGHTIASCRPSLVPLICQESIPKELQGFSLRNVALTVSQPNGKALCNFFGEMNFTENGIGGPIVLSTSRIVATLLEQGPLTVHIDLKPAVEKDELDHRLINDLNGNGNRILNDAMRMWLPAELIPFFFQNNKIEQYKRLNQINGKERKMILNFLKDITLTLCGTRNYEEAIVTQGGVSLKEVNPKTMESKLTKGLFIAGELLDLDADTGGYNLQIAFSTGRAAGMGAALE